MRPEAKPKVISPADFEKIGVSKEWAKHMVAAGFSAPASLKETKATIIQQKLNGYRKKNKLDIPALTPDIIEDWQQKVN
jgi:lysyl-tRNA synthetase class 2